MKFRSVLKKLKPKKKKSAYDGVVKDDSNNNSNSKSEAQSSFRGESDELRSSKHKIMSMKRSSSSKRPQMVQRGPSDESSYQTSTNTNTNSRIRSDLQHSKNERKEPKVTKPTANRPIKQQQQRPAPASTPPAPKRKDPNQPFDQFQDDFGVEPSNAWASFGNSSGFFNATQSSGSLFTDRTAPESESSLSSPASSRNASFESSRSQELSSSEHRPSRISASPPATRPLSSSLHDRVEDKPMAGAPQAPSQERQSDRSLPPSIPLGVRDQRQRGSPTLSIKKEPSPVASSSLTTPSKTLPSQEQSSSSATPSPSPSPISKRRSITARYTAALNQTTASATSSSPSGSPVARKLFRTPSKTSVLDNHPLFRKRSMVEDLPAPVKPAEEQELPKVVTPKANQFRFSSRPSANSLLELNNNNGNEEQVKEEMVEGTDAQTEDPPTNIVLQEQPAEGVAAVEPNPEDSTEAPSEEFAVEPKVAVAGPMEASIEANENGLAAEEGPSTEQEQPLDQAESSSSQDQPIIATPKESQDKGLELEEGGGDDEDMPILSTAPEFHAVPSQAISAVDTGSSSVAQSSKATTSSGAVGDDEESDTETAPIGELSFDSNSNHSEGSHTREGTLDDNYTYDPDAVSVLSEDFTDYSQYTHELSRSKRRTDRFSNWVENTIFGMANFVCPMEEGDVYDA